MSNLVVSLITVSFNSSRTISNTIESVSNQTYSGIEYIIIDGASTDGTVDIINSYKEHISKFVTEPDRGMYDAINKGIRMATGEIVGILNSDDFFHDSRVIERIAGVFMQNETDAVFGDVMFVNPKNLSKTIRYYSSRFFHTGKFKFGYMPAHPSFYVRRELFEILGYYKTDYEIAADFELLLRFMYVNRIKYIYLDMPFVCMRTGGISNKSVLSRLILNKEINRACKENGVRTNFLNIYSKYLTKPFEFIAAGRNTQKP